MSGDEVEECLVYQVWEIFHEPRHRDDLVVCVRVQHDSKSHLRPFRRRPHRTAAALRASARRPRADSRAIRARPPFLPIVARNRLTIGGVMGGRCGRRSTTSAT